MGLLIPRVRALTALCLLVLLLGATATNVIVLDASPLATLVFAAMALAILSVRRHELPDNPLAPELAEHTGEADRGGKVRDHR